MADLELSALKIGGQRFPVKDTGARTAVALKRDLTDRKWGERTFSAWTLGGGAAGMSGLTVVFDPGMSQWAIKNGAGSTYALTAPGRLGADATYIEFESYSNPFSIMPTASRTETTDQFALESETDEKLAGKADDTSVVHKTGTETISGAKTFSATSTKVSGCGFSSTENLGTSGCAAFMRSLQSNPLFGLRASDGTLYYLQATGDGLYLGPTSSVATSWAGDGTMTVRGGRPTYNGSLLALTSEIPTSVTYVGLCLTPLTDGATTSPISIRTPDGQKSVVPKHGDLVVYRTNDLAAREFVFSNGVWTDTGVFRVAESFASKTYDFSTVRAYLTAVEDMVRVLSGYGSVQSISSYDFSVMSGYFKAIEDIAYTLGATIRNPHYKES